MATRQSQATSHETAGGLSPDRAALEVINSISGTELESQLIELARIGGEPIAPAYGQSERYATNRLALSSVDEEARQSFIIPKLKAAGAEVNDEHPLGVIGTYRGEDSTLPPIAIMSHTDTVRGGDMYDGNLGVLGGIEVVRAIHESRFKPKRDISIISLTGEESASFNIALFGSKGMFIGLTDEDLSMTNDDTGLSIRETLGEEDAERVKLPLFGLKGSLPLPTAVIELHVEQGKSLEQKENNFYKSDIGVVHSIASPERYKATIGDWALEPDNTTYPHEKYIRLDIDGVPDHSGATPMEPSARADGFLAAASYLQEAMLKCRNLSIGEISAKDQGMSTIPGKTKAMLRVTGDTLEEIHDSLDELQKLINEENEALNQAENNFSSNPLRLSPINKAEAGTFFKPHQIAERQMAAFNLIESVNRAALANKDHNIVGTVGSFVTTDDGKIILSVDVRGIDEKKRTETVRQIRSDARFLRDVRGLSENDILAGSGDSPVILDIDLVDTALDEINKYEIAKAVPMFSAAGHDTQNAARAGVPSVMLFCRSHNGISHNPDGYTRPEDLEMGVRSLAALVIKLAS